MNGLAVFLCVALQALSCYAGKQDKYAPDNNEPYSDVLAGKFAGSYHSSDDAFPGYGQYPNHNNYMPPLPNYHSFYQQFEKTVRDKLLEKANSIKLVDSALKTKQNGKNTSAESFFVNPKPDNSFEPVPSDNSIKGSNVNYKNIHRNYINGEIDSKDDENLKNLQNSLGSRNVKKVFEAKKGSEDFPEPEPGSNELASDIKFTFKPVYKTNSNRLVDNLVGTVNPSEIPSEYRGNVPIYSVPYYYNVNNYPESYPYYYTLPQRRNPYVLNPQYYSEQVAYNYEYPNYPQYQYNHPEDYYGRTYLNNPQHSVQRGYLPYTYPLRQSPSYSFGYSNKNSIPYYLQSYQPKSVNYYDNRPNELDSSSSLYSKNKSQSENEEYANLVKLLKEVISQYQSGCNNKNELSNADPVSKTTVYTVISKGSRKLYNYPNDAADSVVPNYSQEYSNENNEPNGDQYYDDDYEEPDVKSDLKDVTANKNKKPPVQKISQYKSNDYVYERK